MDWMKEVVRTERWEEFFIHLCWMALVVAAIYGVENASLSAEWKRALGQGIGIFGGVELILDKINDVRRERKMAKLQAKAQREAARADQEAARVKETAARADQEAARADAAEQEAARAKEESEREVAELRRRLAELERDADGAGHKE